MTAVDADILAAASAIETAVLPKSWSGGKRQPRRQNLERRFSGRARLLRLVHNALRVAWSTDVELFFSTKDMPDDLRALLIWPDNESGVPQIRLNPKVLADPSLTRPVATLVHEHRHVMQLRDLESGAGPADELALWKAARRRYVADQEILKGAHYRYNALEVDARETQWRVLAAYWEAIEHV